MAGRLFSATLPPIASKTEIPAIPDYEILCRIGGGSYGEVFLARSVTGSYRAVKIVRRDDFEHEKTFEREFEGIQRYEKVSQGHPGLVDVLHVGRNRKAGFYYYVMDLADDRHNLEEIDVSKYEPRTLASDLKDLRVRSIRECVEVGSQIARALGHLHSTGLIHRDVKPSNIIFIKGAPMLADVGLVARTGQRTFVGTEGYVPSEGPGTASSDLYSLAMVLYEMSTGKDRLDFPELPTNLELPRTINRDQWRTLNTVICRAGSPDARKRFPNGEAFALALERVLQGEEAVRAGFPHWAAAGAAVLLLGGAGFALFKFKDADPGSLPVRDTRITELGEKDDPGARPEEPFPDLPSPAFSGEGYPAETAGSMAGLSGSSFSAPDASGGSVSMEQGNPPSGGSGVVLDDQIVSPKEAPKKEPEPEDPPSPSSRLKITSQPSAAAVWLGDKELSLTPTGRMEFEPGPVSLVLKAPGYHDYPLEKKLSPGTEAFEHVEMLPDRRPLPGEFWQNSLGIEFEPVSDSHICAEISRPLFRKFTDATGYPFHLVTSANSGATRDDAAWADDAAMWAFCDWMTEEDRKEGFLDRDHYFVPQRFSTEGDRQPFFCRIEKRFGGLLINSDPAGAEVVLDGKSRGRTPLTLERRRIGPAALEFRLDGYRPESVVTEVSEGDITPFVALLQRDNSVLFGGPWRNSLGMSLAPVGDLMVSIFETRVQDYRAFLAEAPEGIAEPDPGFPQEPDHPVAAVSWGEARAFCEWLTTKEQTEGLLRPQHRYRLPTDLEWSRIAGLPNEEGATPAIRDTHPFPDHYPWGNEWPPPPHSGNFADTSAARLQNKRIIEGYDDGFPKTAPVGRFSPNHFGLFDLAGNVWEWVEDGYFGNDSKLFVIRGGAWDSFRSENLLTSYRNAVPPVLREGACGFRIVLSNENHGKSGEP